MRRAAKTELQSGQHVLTIAFREVLRIDGWTSEARLTRCRVFLLLLGAGGGDADFALFHFRECLLGVLDELAHGFPRIAMIDHFG